jgi:hypothetical protein
MYFSMHLNQWSLKIIFYDIYKKKSYAVTTVVNTFPFFYCDGSSAERDTDQIQIYNVTASMESRVIISLPLCMSVCDWKPGSSNRNNKTVFSFKFPHARIPLTLSACLVSCIFTRAASWVYFIIRPLIVLFGVQANMFLQYNVESWMRK